MAFTKRSDLVIPELLQEAIKAEFVGMKMLFATGVARTSNTLPMGARGGQAVKVPYFNALGELDDVANEGDALTPVGMGMTSETANVQHSGKAVEMSHWAELAANYADPYAECARQFKVLVERRADKALIDTAVASLPSGYINDISGAGGGTLDYDGMVGSRMKWGDEQSDIRLVGMHSKVFGDLLKLKDSTGRPLLVLPTADSEIPRFCGIPVVVSDRASFDGTKYTAIIAKADAMAFWYQEEPKVYLAKDELADTDVIAIHTYWVAYRYQRAPGSSKPGVVQILSK